MTISKARASLVRALHRRKGRREHDAFLAEGERTLEELASSDASIRFGFARDDRYDRLMELFPGIEIYRVDRAAVSLFATDSSQGLAVVVERPRSSSLAELDSADRPLLVLDAVGDPGNVGTIVRSADWFAIAGVVLLEGCADPFNPKAVRASMGSVVKVPLVESTVEELAKLERPLYVLDAKGEATLGVTPIVTRAAYVIGSEAHGVSPAAARLGVGLAIRGRGSVESLNAAVAASILCYELARRS